MTAYKSFRKDDLINLNVEKDALIEDQKALIAELNARLADARRAYKELQASCQQRVAQNASPKARRWVDEEQLAAVKERMAAAKQQAMATGKAVKV
jgi:hypothetical protein